MVLKLIDSNILFHVLTPDIINAFFGTNENHNNRFISIITFFYHPNNLGTLLYRNALQNLPSLVTVLEQHIRHRCTAYQRNSPVAVTFFLAGPRGNEFAIRSARER
jgi:hypothetical protein